MIVDDLNALHAAHESRHILPFIGNAFKEALPGRLRIAAVGINSYLNDKDWRDTEHERKDDVHDWFRSFWREETWPFYERGYSEVAALGDALATSTLFPNLRFDRDPKTKPCLYATNFVKVFLQEEFRDSTKLEPALLARHAPTWHKELDAMARHRAFPHVIVVFGELIWEPMWRTFYEAPADRFTSFRVGRYESSTKGTPSYHHVNRLKIEIGDESQTTLLLRVAHPSRPGTHNARWLLAQSEFRDFVGLASSE